MSEIAVADARRNFADALNRAVYAKDRVVLLRRRKGVAAIVPMEDLELIEAIENKIDLEEARRILADPKEKSIPWETARKKLGL